MKTITCKRCGAQVDPAVGECPVCGAIYYVISPEEETAEQPNQNTSAEREDPDATRYFQAQKPPARPARQAPPQGTRTPAQHARQTPPRPERPVPPPPSGNGTSRHRRRRRGAAGFAVAALAMLAVLTVILCAIGGVFDFAAAESEKMPYVVGQTESNARAILSELGVQVTVSTSDSPEAAGVVIAQSIPEGRSLKGNETVTLTVSNGSQSQPVVTDDQETELLEVPYVLGESYDSARLQVEGMGLYLIRYAEEFSDRPEGEIIRQEPAAGTPVQKGSAINVTVSKGEEPVEYTISVTAGKGGSVSPKGQVAVEEGESVSFTITPDEGYEIREVKIDGQDVGPVESYVFDKVDGDHTLYAVFQLKETEETVPPTETPTTPPAETDNPTAPPAASPTPPAVETDTPSDATPPAESVQPSPPVIG